jgi:DNA-binding response OmpR family regulator
VSFLPAREDFTPSELTPRKEQLIEGLYSYDKEVGPNAMEVCIHRLRRKIEGCDLEVRTVYGRGYMLDYAQLA